jgi:hypothetical protein
MSILFCLIMLVSVDTVLADQIVKKGWVTIFNHDNNHNYPIEADIGLDLNHDGNTDWGPYHIDGISKTEHDDLEQAQRLGHKVKLVIERGANDHWTLTDIVDLDMNPNGNLDSLYGIESNVISLYRGIEYIYSDNCIVLP